MVRARQTSLSSESRRIEWSSAHGTSCPISESDDVLFISYDVNMPYIYVLFYEEIPPAEYRDSVTFMNPGDAFEWVSSMGRWRFGRDVPEEAALAILPAEKCLGLNVEAQYGYWAVVNTDENF